MQSLLQIIIVNPAKEIPARGDRKAFTVQDAECMLLADNGQPIKVGVLRIPRELRETIKPGVFLGSFGLDASYKDRSIEAVLTGLQEVRITDKGVVPVVQPAQVSK